MKNKSTLLKIRKNKNFLNFLTPGGKKICAKTFYFLKNSRNLWLKFQANLSNFWHWSLKG